MNHLKTKRTIITGLVLFVFALGSSQSYNLILNKESDIGSSRATAYIDSNKIVTANDSILYLTYLENKNDRFQLIVSKTSPQDTIKQVVVSEIEDNHGGGALIKDDGGFLHLFYSGHAGNLYHKRSMAPGDVRNWATIDSVAGKFTYPSVGYHPKSKTIYVIIRERILPNDWSVSFFKKRLGEKFADKKRLLFNNYKEWKSKNTKLHFTQSGYSRWNKSLVVGDEGELYVFFKNYEYLPVDLNFDYLDDRGGASYFISHLYSDNMGESWHSGFNQKPRAFFPKDLDVISGNNNPKKRNGNHNVGNLLYYDGSVYMVFSRTNYNKVAKLFIAKVTNNVNMGIKEIKWDDKEYTLIGPAAFARDDSGNFHILATAIKRSEYCNCTSDWGRESNILVLLALNKNYSPISTIRIDHKFLEKHEEKNSLGAIWLPATEYHVSGQNSSTFIFTVGQKGEDNKEILYNEVYSLKVIPKK